MIDFKTEYAQILIDDFSASRQGAAYRDLGRHARHRHRRPRGREPRLLQARALEDQVLADDRPRHAPLRPIFSGQVEHKEFFYVFDFCQNFEFFNQNPQIAEVPAPTRSAKRLFVQRVELLGEIDKRAGEGGALLDVRADTAERLHDEVAAMSLDNFIVRPKRRAVEKFAVPEAWHTLDLEARAS